MLVDGNKIGLSDERLLFREILNNGKSDVAAGRGRSLVFYTEVFHVIGSLVDGFDTFEVHLLK